MTAKIVVKRPVELAVAAECTTHLSTNSNCYTDSVADWFMLYPSVGNGLKQLFKQPGGPRSGKSSYQLIFDPC